MLGICGPACATPMSRLQGPWSPADRNRRCAGERRREVYQLIRGLYRTGQPLQQTLRVRQHVTRLLVYFVAATCKTFARP